MMVAMPSDATRLAVRDALDHGLRGDLAHSQVGIELGQHLQGGLTSDVGDGASLSELVRAMREECGDDAFALRPSPRAGRRRRPRRAQGHRGPRRRHRAPRARRAADAAPSVCAAAALVRDPARRRRSKRACRTNRGTEHRRLPRGKVSVRLAFPGLHAPCPWSTSALTGGHECAPLVPPRTRNPRHCGGFGKRDTGIEPVSRAWEAHVLPMN